VNRFIADTKRYWKYTIYAAKSQLKTEVANSYLNWIWWVLEPFCFMLIYAFVFGYMFKRKELYFNVYIFVGLAIWDFFNRCVKSSVRMVKRNKAIVSKVYLPKHTLIISDMMVNAFKMMICLMIVFVMLIVYRVPVDWHLLFMIPVLAITILFTFGCCCILMHLGVFIEDMSNVINIVLRFIFYLTGIFYNIKSNFPALYAGILLKCNPLALFINSLRECVMYRTTPDLRWLFIWFVISLLLTSFGIWNIYKNENTYVKVI
jgi:ABC-type polysaccharide/polyol phosphate export permease